MRTILGIVKEALANVGYFFRTNLRQISNVLIVLLPFLMLYIGQYVYAQRGYYAVGGEIILLLVVLFIVYVLRCIAEVTGQGDKVPRPTERFTTVEDDGEVTIRNDRLEELILYMADLEDYMERKNML